MTDQVIPDAPEPAKIATTAVTGASLTKVISPLVGAGAVTASSLIVPIGASIAVAEGSQKILDVVLPDDMDHLTKSTVEGGVTGGVGGAAFTGAAAAQSAAVSALSGATTTTAGTAVAAEGVELGVLGAVEAGLVEATEITGAAAAAEGGLNPIADAAFVASAVGAGIGATVGFFTGLFG
jgi:hypothetical protein